MNASYFKSCCHLNSKTLFCRCNKACPQNMSQITTRDKKKRFHRTQQCIASAGSEPVASNLLISYPTLFQPAQVARHKQKCNALPVSVTSKPPDRVSIEVFIFAYWLGESCFATLKYLCSNSEKKN